MKFYDGEFMEKRIVIDKDMNNRKIEYILTGTMGMSENILKKLRKTEGVSVNGEKVRLNHIVFCGDEVIITVPEGKSETIQPENIPVDILFEDEHIIAVNKPRSMPTHPSNIHSAGTLANAMMNYLNRSTAFRPITRLDKDTSGVVLIAKNHLAAQKLNDNMKTGKICKEYVAVIVGVPEFCEGVITAPIKHEDGSMRRVVSPLGKYAETHYKVEKTVNGLSLVTLNPITGRTHQLRVHMKHIGTPIYGDCLYNEAKADGKMLLHCRKIQFNHPVTGEHITVVAPIPEDITNKTIEKI